MLPKLLRTPLRTKKALADLENMSTTIQKTLEAKGIHSERYKIPSFYKLKSNRCLALICYSNKTLSKKTRVLAASKA